MTAGRTRSPHTFRRARPGWPRCLPPSRAKNRRATASVFWSGMPVAGACSSRTGSAEPPSVDSPQELKARALRFLVRREHSRDELARKLAPYAESNEILEGVLRELESRKQLSNERFAETRANWMARKYGAARIREDLKQKGVEAELLARVSIEGELERARAIQIGRASCRERV